MHLYTMKIPLQSHLFEGNQYRAVVRVQIGVGVIYRELTRKLTANSLYEMWLQGVMVAHQLSLDVCFDEHNYHKTNIQAQLMSYHDSLPPHLIEGIGRQFSCEFSVYDTNHDLNSHYCFILVPLKQVTLQFFGTTIPHCRHISERIGCLY